MSVIVPFQPDPHQRGRNVPVVDGASREDIFSWVRARWEALYPSFELVTAGSGDRLINRSAARNEAYRRSSGDVVIVADADIVFHQGQIHMAMTMLRNPSTSWVIGFNRYEQLSGPDTRDVLRHDPTAGIPRPVHPRWSTDQGNAGLLIMTRQAFERVNGYDERFSAWGWEDWAFANALHTLVHPLVTVPGYVLHLCHPRSRDRSKRQGRPLWNRYEAAFGDREATEALIREEGHGGIEG